MNVLRTFVVAAILMLLSTSTSTIAFAEEETCPSTMMLYKGQCYTEAQICTERLGPRSWFKGGTCGCVPGYVINATKTGCLRDRSEIEVKPPETLTIRRDLVDDIQKRSLHPASSKAPKAQDLETQMNVYGRTRKDYVAPELENYRAKRIENSKATTSYRLNVEYVQVMRVIDGEHMEVRLLDHTLAIVRLLGIDAPSTARGGATQECFGNDASQYLKRLLMRKGVTLRKDPTVEESEEDELLRYVDRGKTDVGMLLLWQGYVRADRVLSYERREHYEQLENEAKRYKRGLWGTCD